MPIPDGFQSIVSLWSELPHSIRMGLIHQRDVGDTILAMLLSNHSGRHFTLLRITEGGLE